MFYFHSSSVFHSKICSYIYSVIYLLVYLVGILFLFFLVIFTSLFHPVCSVYVFIRFFVSLFHLLVSITVIFVFQVPFLLTKLSLYSFRLGSYILLFTDSCAYFAFYSL